MYTYFFYYISKVNPTTRAKVNLLETRERHMNDFMSKLCKSAFLFHSFCHLLYNGLKIKILSREKYKANI